MKSPRYTSSRTYSRLHLGMTLGCGMMTAFVILLYVPLLDSMLEILHHVNHLKETQSFGPPATAQLFKQHLDNSPTLDYQAALMAVSCFVTPQCFHRYKCRVGVPHKIKRNKKWEEMSFCTDDLKKQSHDGRGPSTSGAIATTKKSPSAPCLVYSFGTFHSLEWETKVSQLFQCEVHAFDPTVSHSSSEHVTFHKLGLQGEGTDMASANGAEYDAIDPNRLFTLTQIREKLGHEDRPIDLLMMDCEGCEWGVLNQLICSGEGHSVNQLLVETHFQKSLGLASEHDIVIAGNAIRCLWEDGWGMVVQESAGATPKDAFYVNDVYDVVPGDSFLMYTAFERLDRKTEKTPGSAYDVWRHKWVEGIEKYGLAEWQKNYSKYSNMKPYFQKGRFRMKGKNWKKMSYDNITSHVEVK